MNKSIKTVLSILIAVAVIMGVATSIMTYSVNADIGGNIFAPSKYYEQDIIGADRANKEQMDVRFYISEELIMSRYIEDGVNYSVNVQSQLSEAEDYNDLLKLVMEKLPSFYSQLKIKKVYTGTSVFDLTAQKDIKMFIKFSNGALIYAWLPCNGDYYVHEVCKLKTVKRNATAENLPNGLSISGTTGYTDCENVDIGIIEADYSSDTPYIKAFWKNDTGKTITYGLEYKVYRIDGEKIQCDPTIDNLAWNSLLYTFSEKYTTRDFSLKYYDLSKPGRYSIEFSFEFEGESTEYIATLEFEIADTPENYSMEQNTSELPEEDTTAAVTVYSFDAKVIQNGENYIVVEPDKDTNEYKSSDKIYVSTTDLADLPYLSKGDKVTVTYDGQIQETYPAQILTVYSVKIVE